MKNEFDINFQMFYYGKVLEKANSMSSWSDKIFAFLKGPGWFPGTDRLGDPMGVPEVSRKKIKRIPNLKIIYYSI